MSTDLGGALAALGLAGLTADLAGVLAMSLSLSAGLATLRRTMLFLQASSAVVFAAHFAALGSDTGAAICLVSAAQSLFVTGEPRPWRSALFALSTVLLMAAAILTWHGLASAFAAVASGFAIVGRLQRDLPTMRRAFVGCSLCWVGHNLLVGSAFGLVCDALTLATLGWSLARRRDDKPAVLGSPAPA